MLGALVASTNFELLTREAALNALRRVFGNKAAANETAIDLGIRLVEQA